MAGAIRELLTGEAARSGCCGCCLTGEAARALEGAGLRLAGELPLAAVLCLSMPPCVDAGFEGGGASVEKSACACCFWLLAFRGVAYTSSGWTALLRAGFLAEAATVMGDVRKLSTAGDWATAMGRGESTNGDEQGTGMSLLLAKRSWAGTGRDDGVDGMGRLAMGAGGCADAGKDFESESPVVAAAGALSMLPRVFIGDGPVTSLSSSSFTCALRIGSNLYPGYLMRCAAASSSALRSQYSFSSGVTFLQSSVAGRSWEISSRPGRARGGERAEAHLQSSARSWPAGCQAPCSSPSSLRLWRSGTGSTSWAGAGCGPRPSCLRRRTVAQTLPSISSGL